MKPQPISIPSSMKSEEVETPNWAGSSQPKSMVPNAISYDKYHVGAQIPKMSRLDQLLSRNEEIYQNMRVQLQEISKSNQNIDANISIIKPMYESQASCQDQSPEHKSHQHNLSPNQYLEMYSFQHQHEQEEDGRSTFFKKLNKSECPQPNSHNRQVQVRPKGYAVYDVGASQSTSLSLKEQTKSEYEGGLDASHQLKKHLQKVEQAMQVRETYLEPDSSPIESENHYLGSKSSSTQGKGTMQFLSNHPIRVRLFATKQDYKEMSQKKYQTFEEDQRIVKNLAHPEEDATSYVAKQEIEKATGLTNYDLNEVKMPTRPTQLSLLFIPFNRLYSSPILKQTGPQQLILSRRSKTQVIPINSLDRIVNGIKYKCTHLLHEEAAVYSAAVERIRRVEESLRDFRGRSSSDENREGVDLGIIGGRNSLKKKLHYALIAHIYNDALQLINSHFNDRPESSQIIFTIEHQVQVSSQEPSVLSYKAPFGRSEVENEIELGNINAIISQIFEPANLKPTYSTTAKNVIRVTRLTLEAADTCSVLSSIRIISTNKIDCEFVASLNLDVVVWCVNPLVKYYEDTFRILQCYNAYNTQRKGHSDRKSETSSTTMIGGWR